MKYVVPNPKIGVRREDLDNLRTIGLVAGDIGYFVGETDWIGRTGVVPPTEGVGGKFWRSNSFIWGDASEKSYIVLDRENPGLDLTVAADGEGFSHYVTFSVLSQRAAWFLADNKKYFPVIPRLKFITVPKAEGLRMNFAKGAVTSDYPLADFVVDETGPFEIDGVKHRSSWPGSFVPVFGANGEVEIINLYDWKAPASSVMLTDEEVIGAAQGILSSGMTVAKKAAALRSL